MKSAFWLPAERAFWALTCANGSSPKVLRFFASTIFSPERAKTSKSLLEHKYFELIRHDVTFPYYVEVDEIYNLACPASPVHYQHDPVQTTKTSVHGAINMLGLAKRVKAKILQASTSEVYGDPIVHPQTEDYWGHVNPIGLRSCYDEGKRCAETLFFDYWRQHKLQIKSPAFSIPTGRACTRMMGASYRISLSSAAWARHNHLWRWHSDAFVLLRR